MKNFNFIQNTNIVNKAKVQPEVGKYVEIIYTVLKGIKFKRCATEVTYLLLTNYNKLITYQYGSLEFNNYMIMRFTNYKKSYMQYVNSIVKIIFCQLHMEKIIDLSYEALRKLTNSSDILHTYYTKIWGFAISQSDFPEIDFRHLLPLMFKNRIINISDITDAMMEEFIEYSSKSGIRNRHKYSKQNLHKLQRQLFLKGILLEQPFLKKSEIDIKEYYADIVNQQLKKAIIWYSFYKLRNNDKRIYLKNFAIYLDKTYPNILIEKIDNYVCEDYKKYLQMQIDNKEIPSRNYAYSCISTTNTLFNYLLEDDYEARPIVRDLFSPNIFFDKYKKKKIEIPQHIVEKLLEKAKEIGEYEWALLKVYEGTGMRLNELGTLTLQCYHENAKAIIGSDLPEIRDDICCIKVTSPKILDMERIVLADNDVYKALETLKRIRIQKFPNIPPMYHPKYKSLGKRDFLVLKKSGFPYSDLSALMRSIFNKIGLTDDNGKPIKITTHQFRHTIISKYRAFELPVHISMDVVGHVSNVMHGVYGTEKINLNELIYYDESAKGSNNIVINYFDKKIIVGKEQIKKIYEIYGRTIQRGGYCEIDEFQDSCDADIDCIECTIRGLKSNMSFLRDLIDMRDMYLRNYVSQENKVSDKSIHYLYLHYLYEKLIEKVISNKDADEVFLSNDEKNEIARKVGL